MTGPPPASSAPGGQPAPFPVYPFPPPVRFKPGEPFIPHLTYMEGQFAAQALIVDQQRRIKTLEAELATTQMELMRLRSLSAPQRPVVTPRLHPPVPPDQPRHHVAAPSQPQDDPKKASSRYWTADEHTRFLEGLELFGQKDIKAISRHVGTRSATQVRTHAQKYYLRIQRERVKAEAEGKHPSSDPNATHTPSSLKHSPGGNGPSGNSNQSNSRSHANSNPNTAHSSSHNNSSSSTRNVVNTVKTNISTSRNHTASAEVASSPPKPSLNPEPLVNSSSIPSIPYSSQPYLSSAPDSAIPVSSSAPLPVPHVPENLPALPFRPSAASTLKPATSEAASQQPAMGDPSIGNSADVGMTEHPAMEAVKSETNLHTDDAHADDKPIMQQHREGESKVDQPVSSVKEEEIKEGKRTAPSHTRRSPKKRAKRPTMPQASAGSAPSASLPQPTLPKITVPASGAQPPVLPLAESGGSMSNLRALLRVHDDAGPSASKPPTLRRNGSSNSVLADLSKGVGVLSRSNSFLTPHGKAVTRSNSILSLLSGIPTALRESPSTDRLLGLDSGDDKVMATLKSMDTGGSGTLPGLTGTSASASHSVGALGDRSFSFGQLNHMGLDDLEDPGAVALALQEDQKWGD